MYFEMLSGMDKSPFIEFVSKHPRPLAKLPAFDKNLLFQGRTVPKCHLGVKEKETTI